VDPYWPKPLPNKWVMGNVIGVGVDSRDHVYIVHRQDALNAAESGLTQNPPVSECCAGAPPVHGMRPNRLRLPWRRSACGRRRPAGCSRGMPSSSSSSPRSGARQRPSFGTSRFLASSPWGSSS
jgi:hypothetical protein